MIAQHFIHTAKASLIRLNVWETVVKNRGENCWTFLQLPGSWFYIYRIIYSSGHVSKVPRKFNMLVLHTYTHRKRARHTQTKKNSSGIPISNQCSTVKQTQQTCECSNGEGVVCLYWTNIESERRAIKPIQSHSFGGWQLKLSLFKLSLSKSHFSFFGRHPKSPVRTSSFTGVKKKKKKRFLF